MTAENRASGGFAFARSAAANASWPLFWLAHSLPNPYESDVVFRVAAFPVLIALLASPSTAVVCRTWCDRAPASPSAADMGCHHGTAPMSSPMVGGDSGCDGSLLNAMAFIREGTARLASAPGSHLATFVPRYQLVGLTSGDGPLTSLEADGTFEKRPLSRPLRL